MVRPAFETDFPLAEVFQSGGEAMVQHHLWPAKFTFKELESRYREKGPYEFSAQYLNEPVPDTAADFRKDWFHYVDLSDWRGRIANRYMTIDPAISLAKEADYTGIVIADVDGYGCILPCYLDNLRIPPDKLINLVFQLAENFRPNQIGIEMVAFQKILQYAFNEEMRRRKRPLPIVELKIQDRSKDERIRGLIPLYANGKILHSKDVKNVAVLEEQLLRFPRAKHDDLVDAFASMLELITPPHLHDEDEGRYQRHYLYGQRK
jgi:phage terminase large subunit-like protein